MHYIKSNSSCSGYELVDDKIIQMHEQYHMPPVDIAVTLHMPYDEVLQVLSDDSTDEVHQPDEESAYFSYDSK